MPAEKEVSSVTIEITQTGNLKFEFIDRIGSADLTVTDTTTGQSVTLKTETIGSVPDNLSVIVLA